MTAPRDEMLAALGLSDLLAAAEAGTPFPRAALEQVIAAGNPLAAATLADLRRRATGRTSVLHPWTLRVRAPSLIHPLEDATKVSHDLAGAVGVAATEMEMLGALPDDAPLGLALELVRSVRSARPDLTLRAVTAGEVIRLAKVGRQPISDVVSALIEAGVTTLNWRPGCGLQDGELDVHRAAHACGMKTLVPLGARHGGADSAFLDRLLAIVALATSAKSVLAIAVIPNRTDGASPMDGTSGTDDWMATSLARLAAGNAVPHITTDWHVVGHKLGATMLSCGADDVVGTQAATTWAPITDDTPRPISPDRARLWITEARRSPVTRDSLFREVAPRCA